jgi:chromosome partitioning protein
LKTITIASQKGGVGKSTITIHIAVVAQMLGKDVLIADLDPFSRTLTHWAEGRENKYPTVVQALSDDVISLQEQAKSENFDFLLFDCPPFVSDTVVDATSISDFTLVPCSPTFPEIQSLMDVIDRVKEPYSIVLNNCPSGIGSFEHIRTREVRSLINDSELSIYPGSIVRRVSFQDALNSGKAVVEYEPKSKASSEIIRLWEWVEKKL